MPQVPANQKLKGEIVYQGPLKPPIKKGDQVATFRVTTSSNAEPRRRSMRPRTSSPASFMRKGLEFPLYLALRLVGL